MIRDRDLKKWTSLMLPEQKKMLKALYEEQDGIEDPVLDEQKYEDINNVIAEAIYLNKQARLKIINKKRLKYIECRIQKYDIYLRTLIVIDNTFNRHFIPFQEIIDAVII